MGAGTSDRGEKGEMKFNGRVAIIAAGLTTAVYVTLPDLSEGRAMQVLTFAALYYIFAIGCAWAAEELCQIQKKRNSLDIRSKRPDRGNRDNLKTDIRFRKKSWVVTIPAEKVTD